MATKIITVSGDYGYINQITTTIKSIAYHNQDFKVYVINADIPQEWFKQLNHYLSLIKGQVIDVKFDAQLLANETPTKHEHINYMSYGRLLIPQLVPESKVIYIDSDAIVVDNLTPLYQLDISDYAIAAVKDVFSFYDDFNAGVLIFNSAKILQDNPNYLQAFLEFGQTKGLLDADQSVLNHFYDQHYYHLDLKYNYVIGYDRDVFYTPENARDYFKLMKKVSHPVIIHYASGDKPWNLTSSGRMRDKWWFYHDLEWTDVILRQHFQNDTTPKMSLFTFTSSDQLINIEQLISALPDVQFNIGSWTEMSPSLLVLLKYPNVRLYPSISGPLLHNLTNSCTGYLDINSGAKEMQFIKAFINRQAPIYSFKSSAVNINNYHNHYVFEDKQVNKMVHAILTTTK